MNHAKKLISLEKCRVIKKFLQSFPAIWQFSYSSGNLAGPLLSGVVVEKAGFRSAAALLAGLYCACAVLNPALDFALHFLAAEREKRYSLVQLIT